MRSLFVKIFLWFWVGMALVSFVSLISAVATESSPFLSVPWLKFLVRPPVEGQMKMESGLFAGHSMGVMGNCVRLSGQSAIEIYERYGKTALFDYLDGLEKAVRIHIFLFDAHRDEITGGPIPEEAGELTSHPQSDGLDFKRSGDSIFMAQQLTGSRGEEYALIARLPARHFISRNYSFLAMNLTFILITAGAVCYWLARYISNPICRLGAAARRLADGDLKVRVGALLCKRRDEIADLGKDFDMMAERIESLMISQKRLLRDISHEFRSPLTRLTLALEIARQRGGQDAVNALARIELEAQRLNALIGNLLMLARLESGVEEVDGDPVNMSELIEELVTDAAFEAGGRNCSVRVVSTGNCFVLGTKELLRSAVENVLRNAIHYTAENTEVTVALRCRMEGNARRATIEVRDKGPGVPEESLPNLFYPFYRVGDARDRKQGGTGLGLAITERAARLHGGNVKAANAPGGGLIVTFDLPAKSSG
jgi:two-component system sensor histidine kinase CpxA